MIRPNSTLKLLLAALEHQMLQKFSCFPQSLWSKKILGLIALVSSSRSPSVQIFGVLVRLSWLLLFFLLFSVFLEHYVEGRAYLHHYQSQDELKKLGFSVLHLFNIHLIVTGNETQWHFVNTYFASVSFHFAFFYGINLIIIIIIPCACSYINVLSGVKSNFTHIGRTILHIF